MSCCCCFKASCLSEIGFNSYYTLYDYTKEADISYELSSHTDKKLSKNDLGFSQIVSVRKLNSFWSITAKSK